MGLKGVRIEKPGDLRDGLLAGLRHDGPALIDVVCARQELIMPPKTTLAEARSFGLFALKAVMGGRASELIDLAKVNLLR
jgi:pyruvate dehydrogenase (quinone)